MRFAFFISALLFLLSGPQAFASAALEQAPPLLTIPEDELPMQQGSAIDRLETVESSAESLSRVDRSPAVLPDVVVVDPDEQQLQQ